MTIKSSIIKWVRDYSKTVTWWGYTIVRSIKKIFNIYYIVKSIYKSLNYSRVYCRLLPPGNRSWNLRKLIL